MALSAAQVESSAPDSWTGKPTSIVYEPTADVETWLALRGMTAFSDSTTGEQEEALINATEAAEDYIRGRVRGVVVQEGQRLYLPALGAYEHTRRLMRASGDLLLERAVVSYMEGIRLIAERMRAGEWLPLTGVAGIKREKTRVAEVEYVEGADAEGLRAQHRDVWRKISQILPRLR